MRWERMIELVSECPGIAPAALAERLGVSERTVRADVQHANEQLHGAAFIEKRRGDGYQLVVNDAAALEDMRAARTRQSASALPTTRTERIAYLVNDLVQRTGWVTLDDLAQALFVSRSSLSADMADVEDVLSHFDLALERRPRYGMRVTGTELNRRLCLAALAMRGTDEWENPTGRSLGTTDALTYLGIQRDTLAQVEECINRTLAAHDFHINALLYQNLIAHIAIALQRIDQGSYVPFEEAALAHIAETRECGIAREIAKSIGRQFNVSLPAEEVAYIAIHLAGKQTVVVVDEPTGDVLSEGEDGADAAGIVISDEVWSVVTEMLECIWETFRFDFRNDLELRMNLARHIVPLAVRLRYHMDLKNPLLKDIQARYPLAWSMAVEASRVLERIYGHTPSNDETGYLALAFALALERNRGKAPRKNLLVVCASGAGSARLLEHRCREEFGQYVSSITTCDVMSIDKIDFTHIDYVFTTVPLPVSVPVPVRQVTLFFDAEEGNRLRDFLRADIADDAIVQAFSPELFFAHVSLTSKEEVLAFLCERAASVHGGCEGLLDLVLKREETAPTSFGNDVAMPHPLEAVSDDTFVTVGLLDEPVAWDSAGTMVRAVFLICFARSGGPALDTFFGALAELFMSEQAIAHLVTHQTFEDLLHLKEFFEP